MLQDVLSKKSLRPAQRRSVVLSLRDRYRVSERRGCAALRFDRSTHRYQSIRDEQAALRKRMKEIASVRVRYGYRRIHVLLRREGWAVNHKRVQRLYREEGLNLRVKRPRRHVTAARRGERAGAAHANDIWSTDFVSDALFDGRRFRALTVVDAFTRECLAIEVDQGLKTDAVMATIECMTYLRRTAPAKIRVEWSGVRLSGPGPLGLPAWGGARLLPSGQADGQRLRGKLQRSVARRMPEYALVLEPSRRSGQNRGVAKGL